MNKSESIAHLASALSQAQAELKPVGFNAVNPFLKNKYADLGALIESSRPILAKHGLSIVQLPMGDGQIGVETIVLHTSGEFVSNFITLPLEMEKGKSNAQVAGSIITYLRRYAWAAALAMYADEDTDGNQAKTGEHKDEVKKPPISGQTETKPVTQPKPQWYTVALTAVKEKSSVWDKTLGDTAHGGAFIKSILEHNIGEGQWYKTKADFIAAVQKYTGYKTPEEMRWIDAEHLVRIATNERILVGEPVAKIVYHGILTDTEWAQIGELSGMVGSRLVSTPEMRDDLILWLKGLELAGPDNRDYPTIAANLKKIMEPK